MKRYLLNFITVFYILFPLSSHAEDIEIYRGGQSTATPNLMLVMDTSRSMSRYVPTSRYGHRYDPKITYPKPINGYESDGIYLSKATGQLYNGDGSTAEEVKAIRRNKIDRSDLKCEQAWNDINRNGVYSGKMKHWIRGEGWSGPFAFTALYRIDNKNVELVDCQESYPSYDYQGATYRYMQRSTLGDGEHHPYSNERYWFFGHHDSKPVLWGVGLAGTFYNRAFSGNYLNYHLLAQNDNGTDLKLSRMVVAREGIRDGLFDLRKRDADGNLIPNAPEKLFNVGLARFDTSSIFEGEGGEGGFIDVPMGLVKDNRNQLISKLESYFTWGKTPLTESYFETYRYMTGKSVNYGNRSYSREPGETVFRYSTGLVGILSSGSYKSTKSVAESRVNGGNTYRQPNLQACTKSSIILFTDGAPWADSSSNAEIRNLIKDIGLPPGYDKNCGQVSGEDSDGACADELAYYLANVDQYPSIPGKQTIATHVVGAFLEEDNVSGTNEPATKSVARLRLEAIARAGNGQYYAVDNYEKIRDAFSSLVDYTEEISSSFTSPVVAINALNRLETSNQVYFSMFGPRAQSNWQGNLKRYKLGNEGKLIDAKGSAAVDSTGQFAETSRSIWTIGQNDGPKVDIGGMASRISGERTVYTNLSGNTLKKFDQTIDQSLLYASSLDSSYVTKLRNWIAGKNPDNSVRQSMGDPLHSSPIVFNYGQGKSNIIFVGTNSGYLHAFDASESTPNEVFAFIPKELLHIPDQYMTPRPPGAAKPYGMDGQISYWHKDLNLDGKVNGNDTLTLYVGMRRGGHSYYALDVTDLRNPILKWKIHGKYPTTQPNHPPVTAGFEKLGQSWSKMTLAEIMWKGSPTVVLFTGGGYDADEDDSRTTRTAHDIGNDIFMIKAETGELLWSAQKDAVKSGTMSSAIPSNIVPVDRDGNGFVDLLYASDLGGRVWRFDIKETHGSKNDFAKGGVIADVHRTGSSHNRRFYYAPDISYIKNDNESFILISIGSGYRAHPLDRNVSDYMFFIKDNNALETPDSYDVTTFDNLTNFGRGKSTYGWRYNLPNSAEKVLANSTTYKGTVNFTTYTPSSSITNTLGCQPDVGTSRLYAFNIYNADKPEAIKPPSEGPPGIPPPPVIPPPIPVPTSNPGGGGDDGNNSKPASCADSAIMTLVGPVATRTGESRCDQVKREYWKEL